MSAAVQDHPDDHAKEAPHGHAFDSPEEVAHAKEHAWDNAKIFVIFFLFLLSAVLIYEFCGTKNWWLITLAAVLRCAWIAVFFLWLFRHFSYIWRTFIFTFIFLMGMIWLSIFDSPLPFWAANPINRPGVSSSRSLFQPKPVQPAPAAQPVAPGVQP